MRALTAKPTKDHRHPKYSHLIYFEVEEFSYGGVLVTTPAHEWKKGVFYQSRERFEESIEDKGAIDRGFFYYGDEYLGAFDAEQEYYDN